jgi:hypothetical protein
MKFIVSLLIGFLLCSTSYGQIKIVEKTDAYSPLIAESSMTADVYFWRLDAGTQMLPIGDSKIIHLWVTPGKHEIKLVTVVVDIKIPAGWKTGDKIEKDIKYNEYKSNFEVTGGNPGPIIPDPPGPVIPTTIFKDQIRVGLTKVTGQGLQSKANVGKVYLDIATEATNKPTAWNPASMVNEVKVRNATTLSVTALKDWSGFWPIVGTALRDLKLKSDDVQGHIKAFKDIAEVLIQ